MHFSKPNDPDPEKLPGEFSFGQEKVWQQLERKINRPRQKRMIALVAAACVLIMSGIAAWNLMSDKHPVLTVTAPSPEILQPFRPTDQSDTGTTKENRKEVTAPSPSIRNNQQAKEENIIDEITLQKIPQTVIAKDTATTPASITLTITEPVRQAAVPRFRIAHINDVNPTRHPVVLTTQDASWSLAKKSYTSKEVFDGNGFEPPVKQKGIIGLLRTNQ